MDSVGKVDNDWKMDSDLEILIAGSPEDISENHTNRKARIP